MYIPASLFYTRVRKRAAMVTDGVATASAIIAVALQAASVCAESGWHPSERCPISALPVAWRQPVLLPDFAPAPATHAVAAVWPDLLSTVANGRTCRACCHPAG